MSLTTIDKIKAFMQITTTATDPLLEIYRDIVVTEIEAYVNTKLVEGTYLEALHFEESRVDLSGYYPFNTSVDNPRLFLENGRNVTTFTMLSKGATVSSTNYTLDEDNGVITMYAYYNDSKDQLQANYTSGYTTATAPTDLQAVVWQGVKSYFENNGAAKTGSGNVTAKRIKDFSVNYGNAQTGLVDDGGMKLYIKNNSIILNRYKVIHV